jgi:hypothetical protein
MIIPLENKKAGTIISNTEYGMYRLNSLLKEVSILPALANANKNHTINVTMYIRL